jgi:hypothetical protein
LAFEALALDRAAGVFVPLHLLVSAIGGPDAGFGREPGRAVRCPPSRRAAEPVDKLVARVRLALESALQRSGANSR